MAIFLPSSAWEHFGSPLELGHMAQSCGHGCRGNHLGHQGNDGFWPLNFIYNFLQHIDSWKLQTSQVSDNQVVLSLLKCSDVIWLDLDNQ